MVATRRNDSTFFQMIEPETGNVQWELFRKLRHDNPLFEYEIWKGYQYDKFLIIPFWGIDDSGFEKINLETGEIQEFPDTYNSRISYTLLISGMDSLFYFTGCDETNPFEYILETDIFYGNILTGERKKLCDLPIQKQHDTDTVEVEVIIPTKINNQTHVFIGYSYKRKVYVGLYNKDSQSWVYTNIDYDIAGINKNYHLSYPYFYLSTANSKYEKYFICGNITDGTLVWTSSIYGTKCNNLEIDNKLIVSNDYHDSTICVDKYTGKQLWKINKNPYAFLQELNGIIYFDSGYIYAFDAETGEWLWYLEPHDGTRFNECKVVPGKDGKKGHILASSDKHVYCFEAIR
ncbi:MAG: Outer membrane protein assembly factor BamB [Bacteroidetes bacterium ADurb.Bin217]|nr:MAG: Outer membrane protein assembly factor BamB [Bacteroidetes bacterium ADurb.Bin217]